MRRFIGILIIGFGFFSINPAIAGEKLKLEEDRFEKTKTGSYQSPRKECNITKSLKSRIGYCFLMDSTESTAYPILVIGTVAKGWEILNYDKDEVPTIINYDNGKSETIRLPVKRGSGSVISGGSVIESITIYLEDIKRKLDKINSLEFQYGSVEYRWVNDKELTKQVFDYVN